MNSQDQRSDSDSPPMFARSIEQAVERALLKVLLGVGLVWGLITIIPVHPWLGGAVAIGIGWACFHSYAKDGRQDAEQIVQEIRQREDFTADPLEHVREAKPPGELSPQALKLRNTWAKRLGITERTT